MHKIKTVKLLTTDGDVPLKTFTMYCTDRHGLYEIHKRMSENDYSTNRVGFDYFLQLSPKMMGAQASYT